MADKIALAKTLEECSKLARSVAFTASDAVQHLRSKRYADRINMDRAEKKARQARKYLQLAVSQLKILE